MPTGEVREVGGSVTKTVEERLAGLEAQVFLLLRELHPTGKEAKRDADWYLAQLGHGPPAPPPASLGRLTLGTFRAVGLTWQQDPAPPKARLNARDYAAALDLDGGGWRLPAVAEWDALVKASKEDKMLADVPGLLAGRYWAERWSDTQSWQVDLDARTASKGFSDSARSVRCCRESP